MSEGNRYPRMLITTTKTTTRRTLYVHVVLKDVFFWTNVIWYCFICSRLSTCQVFSVPEYFFDKLCFQLPQNVTGRWITRVINNSNRTEWSPIRSVIIRVINKIGRLRNGSPICQSRVWLQNELDNTMPCYQLIITSTISHESTTFICRRRAFKSHF